MFGAIDNIGTQILQEPEYMEQGQEAQIEILVWQEECSKDEGEADCDGDEDLDIGGEGQPRLKNILRLIRPVPTRGGQTFPKSMEIRNSIAFRAYFSVFFRPCFSLVAKSVSEQLLQCTSGLGGQF